jgi:hypothetical protein
MVKPRSDVFRFDLMSCFPGKAGINVKKVSISTSKTSEHFKCCTNLLVNISNALVNISNS